MKKMMVIAAIVFAAVAANAATMSWSIATVVGPTSKAAAAGWYVALYATGTTFDYAAAKAGTLVAAYTATTADNKGTIYANSTKNNKPDGNAYATGDTADYYAVIYAGSSIASASHYIVSDSKSATVGSTGSNISLAYGKMTESDATKNAFAGSTWTAVPEPTSGILLLVGIAGLALRRRRT